MLGWNIFHKILDNIRRQFEVHNRLVLALPGNRFCSSRRMPILKNFFGLDSKKRPIAIFASDRTQLHVESWSRFACLARDLSTNDRIFVLAP